MHKIHTTAKTQQVPGKAEKVVYRCHILLADDDFEMRRMLAWSLRDNGFKVTECNDGDCLMKRLGFLGPLWEAETFDLIISDIKMPGVTGMQILASAKEYEDFPPTILITAFGEEVTHATAKKLGAAAILDKPFDIDDLLAKVFQILPFHLRSTEQQRVSSIEKTPTAQFPVDIKFRHGCGSDPARNLVLGLAGKLNRFDSLIQHLNVVIDQSNPKEHRKHRYLVTLTVTGPGKPLIVKYNSDKDKGHGNLYLAIQIAFAALYRQAKKNHSKRERHKSHSTFTDERAHTDQGPPADEGAQ